MDEKPDKEDLGGDRACWLDEVCASCGGIGGHRDGCEAVAGAGNGAPADTRAPVPSYVSALTGRPTLKAPVADREEPPEHGA